MKTITIATAIVAGILFSGCLGMFEQVDNSPIGNYHLLFEYLGNDYAYKDAHAFTMEELKEEFLKPLEASPTTESLATAIVGIENRLMDPHFSPPDEMYSHTTLLAPDYSTGGDDFSPEDGGFEGISILKNGEFFAYGRVASNPEIGYVHIKRLSDEFGGSGRLAGNPWRTEIESILKELNGLGVTSMVVDIRSSAGGSNSNARYIANRFANTRNAYMIEEYEGDSGGYEEQTYYASPEGEHHFREGAVALLFNNLTCSGGEMFVLAMLQRENLGAFGSSTRGCAGAVINRDLYNGWEMLLTSSRTKHPDGREYFQSGITPAPANIVLYDPVQRRDAVLERAVEWLAD